jgi:uncharacterized OB-fold protein
VERVRVVDGRPTLVGGRCRSCGHETFPMRARCPSCRAAAVDETALGPDGVVESAVELHVSTAEAEAPYTLGFVRVDGVTLLARVAGGGGSGAHVRLAADVEHGAFWFDAASANGKPPTTEETT